MKIRWIKNPEQEEELVISYREESSTVQDLKHYLKKNEIIVKKDGLDFLLNLEDILFFETDENSLSVHTVNNVYASDEKLYQLEVSLPASFMRISKSTIVNVNQISALEKNITAGRSIRFYKSHKITYASRMYFPRIKQAVHERSLV